MKKYGRDWWAMVFYWRLGLVFDWLIGPCSRVVWVLDRYFFSLIWEPGSRASAFDAWTWRTSVWIHGEWAKLCYGWMQWMKEP